MKRTIVCVGLLALAGCASDPMTGVQAALSGDPVTLTRIAEAPRYSSGMEARARLVVQSEAEWEAAWRQLNERVSPLPPVPSVDFAVEVVVIAAMGTRSSGGFQIDVTQGVRRDDHTLLAVLERSPGRGCFVPAVVTQPVDVVRVARSTLPLRFSEREETRDC